MSSVSQKHAASGTSSLEVVDESAKQGSSATAERMTVQGAGCFLLVERDNVLEPAGQAARPQPPVPSIFEWQRAQKSGRQPEEGIHDPGRR